MPSNSHTPRRLCAGTVTGWLGFTDLQVENLQLRVEVVMGDVYRAPVTTWCLRLSKAVLRPLVRTRLGG